MTHTEHDLPEESTDVTVNVAILRELILGPYGAERVATRELLKDKRFHHIPGLTAKEQRERTYAALGLLAGSDAILAGLPQTQGGSGRPGAYVASFEEIVLADPSLQIKAGVQWGLFGSAVLNLGTEYHHQKWLKDIWSLRIPGCFAMTEIGHGSDVASLATTATYDPTTQEFVIHTPFRAAWKGYIGNAATHGRAAVVFAQLITNGISHGVHAFYVPIRDDNGKFLPGVTGEDDGHKGGLNGVDNGRLCFTSVRIPRQNLLDRYGHVAEDGTYSSPIASPGRRFFTMLSTLVQGRVSLDGAAIAATRAGLAIAVTYADQRRQFTPVPGTPEQTLLDYAQHRRRLFPYIAKVIAAGFAHEQLLKAYDDVFSGRADHDAARTDLETFAAAMKATSTRLALDALQECREACGGAGFLSHNRITDLRHDMDVYATFEGDNTVLLQLVAKRLLSDHAQEFTHMDVGVMTRWVTDRATETAFNRSGLRGLSQTLRDSANPRRSINALRETETQRALLTDRVRSMIAEVTDNMRGAHKASADLAADAFNRNQHRLIEAAKAHAQLLQWEAFTTALEHVTDPGTRQVLLWLRDLLGLSLIEENLGWYMSRGRISSMRGRMVESYVDRLTTRLRPHIMDIIRAFDLAPEHLRAQIATDQETHNQHEAAAWIATERAAGRYPRKS